MTIIPIIQKAADILRKELTKEEFIRLGDALDGDSGWHFEEAINEHLMKDSPEVFMAPDADEIGTVEP